MHARAPEISVLVPTFNRRKSLTRLLDALRQQTVEPATFEVIVVDDGSTDDTVEFLHAYRTTGYSLRVACQSHLGPAAARNLAATLAASPLVLFLDDDVEPRANLIELHLAAHGRTPGAVVIGPMLPPPDWPRPIWIRWEEEVLQVQYRELADGKYACSPRQFYTANASLSLDQFLAVGGFDPQFKRAEDVELAYRLRDAGATFIFCSEAEVLHFASRSFAAWARTPYQYGRYDVVMNGKRHEVFGCAAMEFHQRHVLNRLLARVCVGRKPLVSSVVAALRIIAGVADRLGAHRSAILALSGIFNVLYWQGASDEYGGVTRLWRLVDEIGSTATAAGAPAGT